MKTQTKPASKTTDARPYDVHPSMKMVQNWVESMKEKTGRSLEEWMAFIQKSGPKTTVDRVAWLKKEHGLSMSSAASLVDRAEGKSTDWESPEAYLKAANQYVEDQYSGKKAALRPVFEELLRLARQLGEDVKACPCKTIVPIFRNHVIAQIKATTNTRIDLGFALGDRPASGRLIDTGGFAKKDRITHRIPISSFADIDAEVLKWLETAYKLDI